MLALTLLGCPSDDCRPGDACVVAGTGRAAWDGDGRDARDTSLYLPSDVERLPDGRLLIVDYNNYRVRAIEGDGTMTTIAGSGEHAYATPGAGALESAFEQPIVARTGPDGDLYVAAQHEGRVHRIVDGVIEVVAGTGELGFAGDGGPATAAMLWDPTGLAFHGDAMLVSDDFNHDVRIVRDGVIDTLIGPADLDRPMRIAVDAANARLLVADSGHHRIVAWDLAEGGLTVVAGTGEAGYAGDGGPATAATLDLPQGVAVGDDGTIYVSDGNNHVVRAIAPDGTIDTIAGTGVPLPAPAEPVAADAATLFYPSGLFVDGADVVVASMLAHQVVRIAR